MTNECMKHIHHLCGSPSPLRILTGHVWEWRPMGILEPWSSLHTNNFVWLIQDGARSHRKNWVGSKIPPKEDPKSQIPDGATISISVFRLQLDVLLLLLCFLFRHSSSIVFFKETLRAAMRNCIVFSFFLLPLHPTTPDPRTRSRRREDEFLQ